MKTDLAIALPMQGVEVVKRRQGLEERRQHLATDVPTLLKQLDELVHRSLVVAVAAAARQGLELL